jgi:hypothetical protein
MGILAEAADPNEFGFVYNSVLGARIKNEMIDKLNFSSVTISYWNDIQQRFFLQKNISKTHPELEWILNINFNKINNNPQKILYNSLPARAIRKLKRIISFLKKL